MKFVSSPWYFVIALCVVAIIALIVVFSKMDKKDRDLINNIVKDASAQPEAQPAVENVSKEVEAKEEVKE